MDTTREQIICRSCGACCASFRVSFYWFDAEVFGIADELVEQIAPLLICMSGTNRPNPRCIALIGDVGSAVSCKIYESRPSPCRHVMPGDAKCMTARRALNITNEHDVELSEWSSIPNSDARFPARKPRNCVTAEDMNDPIDHLSNQNGEKRL